MSGQGLIPYTQTDDSEELEKLFLSKPTFNSCYCNYVEPRLKIDNELLIDRDLSITICFLTRGVHGFSQLSQLLQNEILFCCLELEKSQISAFKRSILLYHYTKMHLKPTWDSNWYNLELPNIDNYLKGKSFFKPDSEEHHKRLTDHANICISQFITSMNKYHLDELKSQSENAYEYTKQVYKTYQDLILSTDWVTKHSLTDISEKKNALRCMQDAFNFVCKFSFPAALKQCTTELDNLVKLMDFKPGEIPEMALVLPHFELTLIFRRESPIPLPPPETPKHAKTPSKTTEKSSGSSATPSSSALVSNTT